MRYTIIRAAIVTDRQEATLDDDKKALNWCRRSRKNLEEFLGIYFESNNVKIQTMIIKHN